MRLDAVGVVPQVRRDPIAARDRHIVEARSAFGFLTIRKDAAQ